MMSASVRMAREFALAAHGDQQYGDLPYSFHLDAVVELLKPHGEQAEIVGYLHDVVEDTQVTLDEVRAAFGDFVAECVSLLTDEPGVNRKERKARSCAKLARVTGDLELALVVKAADRLANLRMSEGSKLEMYRREHPAFKQAAYRVGLCDDFWSEMARLLDDGS